MTDSLASSSLDPISIIPESSPVRPSRMSSPRKQDGSRSPTKSVILDAPAKQGESPWRIRVTLEAEANDDTAPMINRQISSKVMTTTVPLKGDSPEPRRRGRPRRSTMMAADAARAQSQGRTPPRRRANPSRKARPQSQSQIDTDAAPTDKQIERRRSRRPRKTLVDERDLPEPIQMAEEIVVNTDSMGSAHDSSNSTRKDQAPLAGPEDVEMPTFHDSPLRTGPEERVDTQEKPLDESVLGEAAIVENEDFSMISVESLSSHRSAHETRPAASAGTLRPFNEPSAMSISYMPSSPPVVLQTPTEEQSGITPQQPATPLPRVSRFPAIMTSHRESAVRTGRVLQDIVRSPHEGRSISTGTGSTGGLFAGFSAETRRELQQSLQAGADMAGTAIAQSSPERRDLRQDNQVQGASRIDHRLPTPDERDHRVTPQFKSHSAVSYPDLTPAFAGSASMHRSQYEDMSWESTGPYRLASPLSDARCSAINMNVESANRNQPRVDASEAPVAAQQNHNMRSVEARRSPTQNALGTTAGSAAFPDPTRSRLPDNDESSLHRGDTARTSKIPNTWTGASGNHFNNSDPPEREIHQDRTTKPITSLADSGVVTPPASDEIQEHDPHDSIQEDHPKFVDVQAERLQPTVAGNRPIDVAGDEESVREDQHEASEHYDSEDEGASEDIDSSHLEATGLYWQLRNQRGRASLASRSTSAANDSQLSDLIPPSSPEEVNLEALPDDSLHENIPSQLDDSEDPDAEPEVMCVVSSVSCPSVGSQDEVEENEQSMTAGNTTGTSTMASYQENLNLSSPAKIKVNFGDSSVHAQQTPLPQIRSLANAASVNVTDLSPRKKWASLFEDGAPLGGRSEQSPQVSKAHNVQDTTVIVGAKSPKLSIMARMTASFWSRNDSASLSASVNDTGPRLDAAPSSSSKIESASKTTGSQVERESTTIPDAPVVMDSTLRLRRRYGLLNASHPFTLAHARTLHRLYQSVVQHPEGTIVPLDAEVPGELQKFIQQRVRSDSSMRFNDRHMMVILGFMDLMLPDDERKRLEAQGGWGDAVAVKARGWDSKGRHGSWFAFTGLNTSDKTARALRGDIEREWLVAVLGGIIAKQGSV